MDKKTLYKFRSPEDPYLENVILKREVYFSKASEFNDPYDCMPSIVHDNLSDDELLRYLRYTTSKHRNKTDAARIFALPKENLIQLAKEGLAVTCSGPKVQEKLDAFSIFCLSARNDSVLMWSHYGQDHKGVCLGFGCTPSDEGFGLARPVTYSDRRFSFNWVKQHKEVHSLLTESIFHKSSDWSYEEEYRIVRYGRHGVNTHEPGALKEVIFGAKADERFRTNLINLCNQLGNVPAYFQATLDPIEYSMTLEKLEG